MEPLDTIIYPGPAVCLLAVLAACCLPAAAAQASPWDGPRVIHDGADLDRVLPLLPIPGEFVIAWAPGPQDSWDEGRSGPERPELVHAGGAVLHRTGAVGPPRLHTWRYSQEGERQDPGAVARALQGLPDVVLAAPLFELEQGGPWMAATPKILLQLADPFYEGAMWEAAAELGLVVEKRRGLAGDQFRLVVPPGSAVDPAEAAMRLAARPFARWAEVSWIRQRQERHVPSDPMFESQWHLDNTGQEGGLAGNDMGAVQAWDVTLGSPDVIIAILDSGVDLDHPDLADRLVPGWDFLGGDDDPSPGGSSHGTSCAGNAGATDQGTGVVGVCPDCLIMPVRMLGADDETEADAVDWAVEHGAWIVSNSWGPTDGTGTYTPISPAMAVSVDAAVSTGRGGLGVAVFWAAGNGHPIDTCDQDGFVSHPSTIAVGASSNLGVRSSYSETCPALDLSAPSSGGANGTALITTTNVDGWTSSFGGTSAAAPIAAAVGGLVLSVHPELTWDGLRQVLRETAEKIDPGGDEAAGYDAAGHSLRYGYGRVDAAAALGPEEPFLSALPSVVGCAGELDVVVRWPESQAGTIFVDVTSGAEVAAFELSGAGAGIFQGEVPLTPGPAVAIDGLLSVLHGDSVVVGSADVGLSATVVVDCEGPPIQDPRVEQVTPWGALLRWETTEPANAFASWGPEPQGQGADADFETEHQVWALDLVPCTDLVASVRSTDLLGNGTEIESALAWTTPGDPEAMPEDAPPDADPCDPSTWEPDDDDVDDDLTAGPGGFVGSGTACRDCGSSVAGGPAGWLALAIAAVSAIYRRRR